MNQKSLTIATLLFCFQWMGLVHPSQVLAQTRIKKTQFAQIAPEAVALGFNTAKLQSINQRMNSLIVSGDAVGCSALILKDNQEVYFGAWGDRDREKEKPLTRDTIFRIYSMTKPITSIAVMQLVEQGKIDLDIPVSEYLPELKDLKVLETNVAGATVEVLPKRPMTTRDLLRHTSGLTYGFFGDTEIDKRYRNSGILSLDRNIQQTVTKLGKIPLLNHPGSTFVYSASTDVLGRLVEVISGQLFDKYLQEHIFAPLEMHDTGFSVPIDKQDRLAQLYSPAKPKGLKPANPVQSLRYVSELNEFFSGGGGLCSTIDDYANFCKLLLDGGEFNGKQIVKSKTLDEMFTNQLAKIDHPPGQFKFGLGFAVTQRGDYTWSGAAGTGFWVNPEKKLAIIYMIQIMPNRGPNSRDIVREATYSALRK